jgi:3-phosphoshikimate 1-carboxyvinyltransferase
MHQRPIELLLEGLRDLGGSIVSKDGNGCPPLSIGTGGLKGGETALSGQVSSQYFSGLMMAGPLAESPCLVKVTDEWLSRPYIELTSKMLASFGIETVVSDDGSITIAAPQEYVSPGQYDIEPDATAASYPLGLGVLQGVKSTVMGLGADALQGDVAFVKALEQMGCEVTFEEQGVSVERKGELKPLVADLNNIPDAAMTAVVLCAVTPGHSSLKGLKNLAFKECDRLTALATELNKVGCRVQAHEDGFEIDGVPLESCHGAQIETYKDHRMAMCLGILGTVVPGIEILDPSCVNKTYPHFWKDLEVWCG